MADIEFDKIFGFLGAESEIKIPEGGSFANTGFIGPLMAKKLFKVWSRENIADYAADLPYKENVDYTVRGKESSHWYYFVNEDAAKAAAKVLEAYAPNLTWRFEMPTAGILNFQSADAADKFGQAISADVRIVGLGSKYRHEYHMLSLPSLVDAAARATGKIKAPVWHCAELLEVNDSDFTDEFQWRLIGHPDAKKADLENFLRLLEATGGDVEKAQAIALGEADIEGELAELKGNVRIPWQGSLLWKRRVLLWHALGEDNPETYLPKGDSKVATTSDTLSYILGIATREWTAPMWARMHSVPDPSMSNVYTSSTTGNVRHGLLPVVGEIYANEAAARAAVEAEGGTPAAASVTAPATGYPQLPDAWYDPKANMNSLIQDFVSILGAKKKELDGTLPNALPKSLPEKAAMARSMGCAIDDLINKTTSLDTLMRDFGCSEADLIAWWPVV